MVFWNRKREETITVQEHERILSHARHQRDYWMNEARKLKQEKVRRLAPLYEANARRKREAAERKGDGN